MKNQIFTMANAREYNVPNSQTTITTERALVESISLEPSSADMTVGDTKTITATVLPAFASTKDLEWKSENPDVATVSQDGVITAVGVGQTTITATAVDGSGVEAKCEVAVSGIAVTSISLDISSAPLKAGETLKLTATVNPVGAYDKSIHWESSDVEVATVDEDGNITAVAIGDAVITATSVSNPEISSVCNITVIPTPVTDILLNQTSVTLQVGETFTFNAIISPDDASNKVVSWSSENALIASVDENGTVSAHSVGSVVISATATDGSGITTTAIVNVVRYPESITLSQNDVTLKEGESQALTVEVLPEDSLNKDVKWSSSDEDIVTVSDDGVLTAISEGQAMIVVRSVYNPELYDECLVTVIPVDTGVADISIDNVSIGVEGHSIYLTDLRAATAISITTIDGYRVYFSETNSSTERIDLDGPGIYIVKIGNMSVKLAIN